jgi:hypothetical protein
VLQDNNVNDNDNDVDNGDSMSLGYPDLPEQQQQDSLFLPGSDDGYGEQAQPPAASKMSKTTTVDEHIDFDEIPQPPARPPLRPPPAVGSPASTELPVAELELDPPPPRGLVFSSEVPETQSQQSSNLQCSVDEPRQVSVLPSPKRGSSTDAALSKPEISRKSSSSAPSSPLKSRSNSKAPTQPVVASTSNAVPAIDLNSRPKKSKPLGPVPQVSPSQFHPHLPVSMSIPPPGDGEAASASPLSSIGSFSSPEKQKTQDSRQLESIKNWGDNEGASRSSQRDTILGSDDALRAQEQGLADSEREKRQSEWKIARDSREKAKIILSDLAKPRDRESEFDLDQTEESIIVQKMVDAYVDLSGGGAEEEEEPLFVPLAQEEEESTQDLERERHERMRQQAGEDSVQQRTTNGWGAESQMDVRFLFGVVAYPFLYYLTDMLCRSNLSPSKRPLQTHR